MNARAYVYVAVLFSAALATLAGQSWTTILALEPRDLIGLGSFIALGILSEALAIDFRVGSNRSKSSISFLPVLAASITFHPTATIAATFVIELFTDVFIRHRVLWLIVFNTSQGVLAIAGSLWIYSALGGPSSDAYSIDLLAFTALALSFFSINVILVSLLYSLRQRRNVLPVVRALVGPGAGNLLYGLLASPVAVFAGILYNRMYIGGLILMILPLLLIRYSYLSKVQLQQANRDLLRVLIKTIETRDPYTSGHSVRVSSIARMIAEDLGLGRRKIEEIETAGLLHDIGKIDMIYATIIQKPADLTDDERRIINTHAVKGAELLRSLTSFSEEVVKGVLHHHERYDGTGYPAGLAAEAIPLAARIIMLCDSIDAMLSDRSYRSALSVDHVEREIKRCAGTQFDPDIVEAIIRRRTVIRALTLVREHIDSATISV